jgi:hypothetical protein
MGSCFSKFLCSFNKLMKRNISNEELIGCIQKLFECLIFASMAEGTKILLSLLLKD